MAMKTPQAQAQAKQGHFAAALSGSPGRQVGGGAPALAAEIAGSPRMVAQRRGIQAAFGEVAGLGKLREREMGDQVVETGSETVNVGHTAASVIQTMKANELIKLIKNGNKFIGRFIRCDRSLTDRADHDELHIQYKGKNVALYRNGTWKHKPPDNFEFTNDETAFLEKANFKNPFE